MTRIYLTSLLLLILCTSLNAQNKDWLTPVSPSEVKYSSETVEKLENYIQKAVENKVIPGGTFIIAKNGRTVLNKSFGQVNDQRAYKNDDIYRIASMTKAITCVSIMQLVDKGLIDLDAPVSRYIPAFKQTTVLDKFDPADSSFTSIPKAKELTIRNLMTHTSGIVYGSFNPGKLMAVYDKYDMNVGFSHPEWSNEEWMNRLAEVPLAHQPGARFSYGLNMDVLGHIIEVVSGQSLDVYFNENIFEPIGMNDTYFYLPKDKFDRLTPVMSNVNGTFYDVAQFGQGDLVNYPMQGPRDFFAGGAGLSSTAIDYTIFIETLVEGGGKLLSSDALKLMTSDQMPLVINDYENYPKNPDGSFCLGFTLYQDGPNKRSPKSAGTYEWGGYFNTKFFIDPKEQLVFTGMTQIAGFQDNQFWNELYAIIYEGIE